MNLALLMLTVFIVKHFFCDFLVQIQTPWMSSNKGTYGHPGGIAHASIHVIASAPILLFFDPGHSFMVPLAAVSRVTVLCGLLFFEWLVHYHMDWFKMWWCKRKGYRCNTHTEYWFWIGLDQMVHYLTYIVMVLVWM